MISTGSYYLGLNAWVISNHHACVVVMPCLSTTSELYTSPWLFCWHAAPFDPLYAKRDIIYHSGFFCAAHTLSNEKRISGLKHGTNAWNFWPLLNYWLNTTVNSVFLLCGMHWALTGFMWEFLFVDHLSDLKNHSKVTVITSGDLSYVFLWCIPALYYHVYPCLTLQTVCECVCVPGTAVCWRCQLALWPVTVNGEF